MSKLLSTAAMSAVFVCAGVFLAPASAEPWSGAFVGFQVGDTYGNVNIPFAAPSGGPLTGAQPDIDVSGISGGVHLGYDYRLGGLNMGEVLSGLVIGVVGDYTFADLEGYDAGGINAALVTAPLEQNKVELDRFMSVRAKVGFLVMPGSLLYATGGYVWANGNVTAESPPKVQITDVDFSGSTFGVGAEFRIGEAATIALEWRTMRFDEERLNMAPRAYDLGVKPDLDVAEVRLNYLLADLF